MDFGQRLKALRLERSITQEELAKVINVRRPAISGYEMKGQQPDFDRLCRIAEYFSVSLDYLLGRTEFRDMASPPSLSMSADDSDLLSIYRKLSEQQKGALKERARVMLETDALYKKAL